MKPRHTLIPIVTIGMLLTTPPITNMKGAPEPQQQQLRRKFRYTCNGETIVIVRCRKDSDMPGYPPTKPEDNYCAVDYPDRPPQNGISIEKVELHDDVIKKLQACGALNPPSATRPPSSTSQPTTVKNDSRSKTSHDLPAVVVEADRLYSEKKFAAAIEGYKKVVVLKLDNPILAKAHFRMGYAYFELKQNENSLLHLREALRLNPNDPDTNFGAGYIHYQLKQYAQALAAFQKTINLNSTDAEAQYWVGETYLVGLDEPEKAIPYLRESLRLRPNDARTRGELGVAYYHTYDFPAAIDNFQEAIRLKPKQPDLYRWLGVTYVTIGRRDDAISVYHKLQTLDPKKAKELYDKTYKYCR